MLSSTSSVSSRNFGLDVVRATAIAMVVIAHGTQLVKSLLPADFYRLVFYLGGYFGVELFFADCLWQFDGAVGARNVAVALATMSEEVEDRADDDDLTPYMWLDGTQLTKRELRAWLRA